MQLDYSHASQLRAGFKADEVLNVARKPAYKWGALYTIVGGLCLCVQQRNHSDVKRINLEPW